jgi:hypothetical protein
MAIGQVAASSSTTLTIVDFTHGVVEIVEEAVELANKNTKASSCTETLPGNLIARL